jgi:23S rRNA (adenine2030-N6)-methyltransferase
MNYRHAFHAGNFADVVKHAMLTRILVYLTQKPTALRYIDTHAGAGRTDLGSDEAARTAEWHDGIARILAAASADAADPDAAAPLALLAPYLAIVRGAQPFYPGSPALAAALTRPQDRLVCCELHPPTAATLSITLGRRGKAVEIDGYTALKAFVPPPERRGVVLIDPPFEQRDEFVRLGDALATAWRKWPTGVYLAWYPLKDVAAADAFAEAIKSEQVARVLRLTLQVAAPRPDGPLVACGLVVVNPPFGFEAEAQTILPYLARTLGLGPWAASAVTWLSAP